MKSIQIVLIVISVLFVSCRAARVATTWKAQNVPSRAYNEILVVSIVKENNIELRKKAESLFVKELEKLGYKAASSVEMYGKGGLTGLSQEDTYIKLRNKGIGAVLTVALIDKNKEKEEGMDKVEDYNTPYYYKRVWHYNKMRADVSDPAALAKHYEDYYWEAILFEINALETHYMLQTSPLKSSAVDASLDNYAKVIFKTMRKNGVLKEQKRIVTDSTERPVKAF